MHENHCEKLKVKEVISLAPFLEQQVLDEWVFRTDFTHHLGGLSAIAPFVSKEVLAELFQLLYLHSSYFSFAFTK